MVNANKPRIAVVRHADLESFGVESLYKKDCPVCGDGILLVYRDQKTLEPLNHDRCLSCGQAFEYTDREIGGELVKKVVAVEKSKIDGEEKKDEAGEHKRFDLRTQALRPAGDRLMDYEKAEVGQRSIYSEDGYYTLVEILEVNHSDEDWGFRLRSLSVLDLRRRTAGHAFAAQPTAGFQWSCMQKKTGGYGGMWHLRSVEEFQKTHPDVNIPDVAL